MLIFLIIMIGIIVAKCSDVGYVVNFKLNA